MTPEESKKGWSRIIATILNHPGRFDSTSRPYGILHDQHSAGTYGVSEADQGSIVEVRSHTLRHYLLDITLTRR